MVKGEKIYKIKDAELKVEKYDDLMLNEGARIGYYKLNLATFVNKGLQTVTFPMDKNGAIFLTA